MTATTITTAATAISAPNNRKKIKVANAVNGISKKVDFVKDGSVYAPYYGVTPSFMTWTSGDVVNVVKCHWLPCFSALGLLFFMAVEYTLTMVPANSPPFDLGFVATRGLHRVLSSSPELNSWLAGLNTVFVAMQAIYILWAWLIEGRPRATISTLFMFACRGILGCSTQLPVPEEFLGSGVDFPVGNVSFFLFFSGHVAGAVIASLDMRRKQRWELAWTFDLLNVLQVIRLLGARGHYTIDLAAGAGAGLIFDSLGGKYEDSKKIEAIGNITKDALFVGENKEFIGSGVDFPVGTVLFFLFFSGRAAGAVIASLDLRRKQKWELAWTFDLLNVLQVIRLLGTRGHYTIDLVAGAGAGLVFDSPGGKYEESKKIEAIGNITKDALFLGENKVRQC